jgi:hypothetical protein
MEEVVENDEQKDEAKTEKEEVKVWFAWKWPPFFFFFFTTLPSLPCQASGTKQGIAIMPPLSLHRHPHRPIEHFTTFQACTSACHMPCNGSSSPPTESQNLTF